ncbi:hypothetical protein [Modestobacter sp. Leaf380]|uniref:hypothetical protein n=1 Tax=Modestobacter sp. Leaf380 TaxID=1736356 RepID=UPI0006FE58F5|nr:hypothetical protein [Modestobacter sp. Leaf380]KQS68644.1 hypothetical protein ASG41_06860 [Modestobacter sp. Leaf380]
MSADHRLPVVTALDPSRTVLTSLPRGRDAGHRLLCGSCGAELAHARRPMAADAPLLRCVACGAVNDAAAVATGA